MYTTPDCGASVGVRDGARVGAGVAVVVSACVGDAVGVGAGAAVAVGGGVEVVVGVGANVAVGLSWAQAASRSRRARNRAGRRMDGIVVGSPGFAEQVTQLLVVGV